MASLLKKTEVKLEFLTDIDMLLMIEEGIRGGICHVVQRYAKANNKYMNNYNKSIISSFLMYLDANNLYGWAMSQKLPVNSFKWVEELSKFNERFIKSHNENSDIGYFLEVYVKHPKKLFNLHKNLPCLPERKKLFDLHKDLSPLLERKKLEKVKKLVCNIEDKKNMLFT